MHVISRKALVYFSQIHPDAEIPLDAWYRIAKSAKWTNIVEVKKVYSHADRVAQYTVFNIKGNDYRLISEINYRSQVIFIRDILTHSEYSERRWKE